MRRYTIEVSGLPDEVTDEEVRAALAERVVQNHRIRGGTGLSVGTSGGRVDEAVRPSVDRRLHRDVEHAW